MNFLTSFSCLFLRIICIFKICNSQQCLILKSISDKYFFELCTWSKFIKIVFLNKTFFKYLLRQIKTLRMASPQMWKQWNAELRNIKNGFGCLIHFFGNYLVILQWVKKIVLNHNLHPGRGVPKCIARGWKNGC